MLQQYIDKYYGRSLSTRVLYAVMVTIITFVLINWLLNHFQLHERKMKKVYKADLTNYVQASYGDEEHPIVTNISELGAMS